MIVECVIARLTIAGTNDGTCLTVFLDCLVFEYYSNQQHSINNDDDNNDDDDNNYNNNNNNSNTKTQ